MARGPGQDPHCSTAGAVCQVSVASGSVLRARPGRPWSREEHEQSRVGLHGLSGPFLRKSSKKREGGGGVREYPPLPRLVRERTGGPSRTGDRRPVPRAWFGPLADSLGKKERVPGRKSALQCVRSLEVRFAMRSRSALKCVLRGCTNRTRSHNNNVFRCSGTKKPGPIARPGFLACYTKGMNSQPRCLVWVQA